MSYARPVQEWQLSPDKLWELQQRRQRNQAIAEWSIAALTCTLVAATVVKPFNEAIREGLTWLQGAQTTHHLGTLTDPNSSPSDKVAALDSLLKGDMKQPPRKGEKILGYAITSEFGQRERPCPTCSEFHRGVDVATPEGVQIYAIGKPGTKVRVECKQDTGGGGLYAVQTSPDFPNLSFESLHLSQCADGEQPAGSVIARTGNSGEGTGAHWHFQVRKLSERTNSTGGLFPPPKGFLFWALSGNSPMDLSDQASNADPASAVVAIYGGTEIGSGVSLGDLKVITNYHVVAEVIEQRKPLYLNTRDGQQVSGKLVKHDKASDLALIQVDADLPGIPLAKAPPQPGEPVQAIGNRQNRMQTTQGRILSVSEAEILVSRGLFKPGNSGGALVNQKGELIGIPRAASAALGSAIPVSKIRGFAG